MKKEILLSSWEGKTPFPSSWKRCIGSGSMSLMMRSESEQALRMIQEEIGFDYIRGHGILSDTMATYQEIPRCKSPYNFTYVDKVYDLFQKLGIRPIVELGFMPNDLASGNETVFYWKGNITLPNDWKKWCELIHHLVVHLIERYGIDEVRTWPFEVWNEPNFDEFWVVPNLNEYWKMYTLTVKTIKAIDKNLIVGGPAADTNGDAYLEEFLIRCKSTKTPIDFVSRHAYLSTKPMPKGNFDYQKFHKPAFVLQKFENAVHILEKTGYSNLPIFITEFNTSYTPKNPIHDTIENAVMLAPILTKGGDLVEAMAYWTFSDVFEELGIPRCQFHGGFGLVGFNGVRKPTFHLYRMMSKLKDQVLYRDSQILICSDGDHQLSILAWNNEAEANSYTIKIPSAYQHLFSYQEEINQKSANPRKAWVDMGYPPYPSQEQLAILHLASVPHVTTCCQTAENGYFKIALEVEGNGIVFASYCAGESQKSQYDVMDDDQIVVIERDPQA